GQRVVMVSGAFSPLGGRAGSGRQGLPRPPSGWPIGSYATYEEAQRAVDHLAEHDFAMRDVTIVGIDLMLVERVVGKLSWGKVLGTGAGSGAWFGLFIGLLLGLFGSKEVDYTPVVVAVVAGAVFGVVFASLSYATTRRYRDFSSSSQLVAGRYDVLCQPRNAEQGRDLLARLAMRPYGGGAAGS